MRKFFFKRIRIAYSFLFFICYLNSYAIIELTDHDTRSFTLGEIHALGETFQNPAALTLSEKREIGLNVFNRFQIKELNTAQFYIKYPMKWITNAIRISSFGYNDYQLLSAQFSFAKQITPKFNLGTRLVYLNESSLLEENRNSYYSAHLGLWYLLNEEISFAALVENLLSNSLKNPIKSYMGVKYSPYENIYLLLESSYSTQALFNLSVGCEYYFTDHFILRSGILLNPKKPSFGIAYLIQNWQINTGFSFHSVLGISSSIGIQLKI